MRPAHFRPFIPIQAKPAEPFQNRAKCLLKIALLIGVVDAENELAAMFPSEQPVEERRAHSANMKVAPWDWERTWYELSSASNLNMLGFLSPDCSASMPRKQVA